MSGLSVVEAPMPPGCGTLELLRLLLGQEIEVGERVDQRGISEFAEDTSADQRLPSGSRVKRPRAEILDDSDSGARLAAGHLRQARATKPDECGVEAFNSGQRDVDGLAEKVALAQRLPNGDGDDSRPRLRRSIP